ncbi:hypothetical protein VT84_25420 [Gemmata sp. SH-PL17]|uniref:hypothetical protein n=1 Tax=Gemmata sp. SH-PL17 TaxID=1630693 RepID=UPI00078BF406|nr:hypothetical protein [Gemmata sp. SH-PL17]AMV27767.1 hypothetical protein VT84_25420 [Gemmata sp. SH-PL17]
MTPTNDPRAALAQLVVRLRAAPPADRTRIVGELLPFLASPRVPLTVRSAAAGRALDALPDTQRAVQRVVRALTGRVSPSRGLARLRHLQRLTERSDALDAIIARRERKIKMSCPRCDVRLSRPEMAKHLWHEHGLMLVKSKTRSRARAVEAIRREHAATGEPNLIDRAGALDGERAVRILAAETATADETVLLRTAARERGAGLCPTCLADVVPQVPPPPPALAMANGRLAGDGFVARGGRVSPARARATLAAGAALIAFSLLTPVRVALILSLIAYVLTRVFLGTKTTPADRAVDAGWRKLAWKLVDRRDSARFLTRLCLTSVGLGDPFERASALSAVIARARGNVTERQLLATALALQIDDGGRLGRDRATGIAELLTPVFRGDQPADFAEFVLAVYLRVPRDPAERGRLRVLILLAAFRAELTARDVLDLCDVAPHVATAVQISPNYVAMMYGVWVNRTKRPWERVGYARTMFDAVVASPATAGKLLTHEPGLLLMGETDPGAEAELGPILVALGGVSVGGVQTSDPEADVYLESNGRVLVFGRYSLRVSGRLSETYPEELQEWLRFRDEVLMSYPTEFLESETPHTSRLLTPFVTQCQACGTKCLPVVGAVSYPWQNS